MKWKYIKPTRRYKDIRQKTLGLAEKLCWRTKIIYWFYSLLYFRTENSLQPLRCNRGMFVYNICLVSISVSVPKRAKVLKIMPWRDDLFQRISNQAKEIFVTTRNFCKELIGALRVLRRKTLHLLKASTLFNITIKELKISTINKI